MNNTCSGNCHNCGNCVHLDFNQYFQRFAILKEKPGKDYYCPKKDDFMNPDYPACTMYFDRNKVVITEKKNINEGGFQRVHKHSVNRQ